jgi:hypothetical protein
MKNERSSPSSSQSRSLDQRLVGHPELAEKFHALMDQMEESLAQGAKADEVEEDLQEPVRQVGQQALTDWAAQAQEQISSQTPAQYPGAVKHAKKNFSGKASSASSKSRNKSGA